MIHAFLFLLFFFSVGNVHSSNFTTGADFLDNPAPSAQSTHTLTFTTTQTIPSNGDILITIPAVDATGQTNNGVADSSSTVREGGFDLNGIGSSHVLVASEGCSNNWTVNSVIEGDATSDHKIRLDRNTDSCAAGATITIIIGNSSNKLINPAPLSTPSANGKADIYTLHIRSRDGSDNKLDQLDVRVAIVSPSTVSATVAESFSFELAGVPQSTKTCNVVTDIATTGSSVAWGSISKPFTFKNAAHLITVSTNAKDGYAVTVSEDNQLRRSNSQCRGGDPRPLDGCIPDTKCDDGRCTDTIAASWTDPGKTGFGYSLENLTEQDTAFNFGGSVGFNARRFPDKEAGQEDSPILVGAKPTLGSSAHVCYRIAISDIQPAGYYTNYLLYTALPRF